MRTKLIYIALLLIGFSSCSQELKPILVKGHSQQQLDSVLNQWHLDAANGNFDSYFSICSEDFVFMGTDSTERWTRKEFEGFCKPAFSDGSGWDFKVINRFWNFSKEGNVAWFDESLDTWMKDCRGTGVFEYSEGGWALKHYSLTVLVENEIIQEYLQLKDDFNTTVDGED